MFGANPAHVERVRRHRRACPAIHGGPLATLPRTRRRVVDRLRQSEGIGASTKAITPEGAAGGRPSSNCKLSICMAVPSKLGTPDSEPYRLRDHYSLARQIGEAASGD